MIDDQKTRNAASSVCSQVVILVWSSTGQWIFWGGQLAILTLNSEEEGKTTIDLGTRT